MGRLTAITPAPRWAALEAAGRWPFMRRAMILQRLKCETVAFVDGDELLAIGMLFRLRTRLVEFALAITPAARPHMRRLIRHAHLTLAAIAETGVLVMSRISPSNEAGKRMARLTGFTHGRMRDPSIWLWKGDRHG